MADELGFWAFRVDKVFPEETHTRLVNLIDTAFHLDSWVSDVMHKHKQVKGKFDYKVINMGKYPCMCTDRYAGLSNHTFFQWGQPSKKLAFQSEDGRPSPPPPVEKMTNTS